MSFDLDAFPPSGPRTALEVGRLLDAEEQRLINGTDDALRRSGQHGLQWQNVTAIAIDDQDLLGRTTPGTGSNASCARRSVLGVTWLGFLALPQDGCP